MEAVLDLLLSVSVYVFWNIFLLLVFQSVLDKLFGGRCQDGKIFSSAAASFVYFSQSAGNYKGNIFLKKTSPRFSNGCAKKSKILNSSLLFLPQLCMINIHVSTKFKNILMKTEHLPALVLKYHYFTSSEAFESRNTLFPIILRNISVTKGNMKPCNIVFPTPKRNFSDISLIFLIAWDQLFTVYIW